MAKLLSWLNDILEFMAIILIFAMLVVMLIDVFGRYILSSPLPAAIEIVSLLLATVVFLALGSAEEKKANIRMELIVERLPVRPQSLIGVFGSLLGLFFFGLLVWGLTGDLVSSWHLKETMGVIVLIPIWPVKVVIVLGSVVLCVNLLKSVLVLLSKTTRLGSAG